MPSQLLTVPPIRRMPLAKVLQMQSSRLHFVGTWRNRYRKRFFCLSAKLRKTNPDASPAAVSREATIVHVGMALTVASPPAKTGPAYPRMQLCISQTKKSTLPPILNAMEMYVVTDISQSATNKEEVHVIMDVKAKYGANKLFESWRGDPCLPKIPWDGQNCSDNGNDSPRIISLNWASRSLRGEMLPSLSSLELLNHLNLSNNDLPGAMSEFLANMPSLRVMN